MNSIDLKAFIQKDMKGLIEFDMKILVLEIILFSASGVTPTSRRNLYTILPL